MGAARRRHDRENAPAAERIRRYDLDGRQSARDPIALHAPAHGRRHANPRTTRWNPDRYAGRFGDVERIARRNTRRRARLGRRECRGLRSRFADFPDASITTLESTAEIEVTYQRNETLGMWLPERMTEEYEGAIPRLYNAPVLGISRSNATYSDYKRFGTSTTVVGPKK